MIWLAVALAVCLLSATAHAEVLELEGTVKAVDASARSITIERKTPKGTKTLELEVTKKAGDLSSVKAGDSISFTYDPDLEIILKFATGSGSTNAAGEGSSGGHKGTPLKLIRRNTLEGWEFEKPVDEPTWAVCDEVLVCTGEGPNLRTVDVFSDFELAGEFLLPSRGNSGIFFGPDRKYEFALLDSLWRNSRNEQPRPDERCGAIYGKIAPSEDAYVGPNKWNRFTLIVDGNSVSAKLNGRSIHRNQRMEERDGSSSSAPAPLVLQRHGYTVGIKFRNLVLTPLNVE